MTNDNIVTNIPLCVDLDGTLVKTDLLFESFLSLIKLNLLYLFLVPLWWLKGKANFKHQIAKRVDLDVNSLPYNQNFIKYLSAETDRGRLLILATASNEKYAIQIANKIGIFSEVLASNQHINLSRKVKADLLIKKYGKQKFDYAGNSSDDLIVWEHSRKAIVVNADRNIIRKVEKITTVQKIVEQKKQGVLLFLKAIRIHQWVKNVLIFIPIVTAHQITNFKIDALGFWAFLSFSFCSSGIYVLNDLIDLESDRLNEYKKNRPFASADLSIQFGLTIIPLFLTISFALAVILPPDFMLAIACYLVFTTMYTFYFKKIIMLDVIVLAFLYTMRIIAGHEATGIPYSFWLFAFSLFLFFSLALLKRYSELYNLQKDNNQLHAWGRGYYIGDISHISQIGSSSGLIAILILALYINSREVMALYQTPMLLWLICPLMLYWISRVWLKAGRGEIHEDPIIFAFKDKVSYILAVFVFLIIAVATYL